MGPQSMLMSHSAFRSSVMAGSSTNEPARAYDEETLEFLSSEMSFSALYLHELHRRRLLNPLNPYFDDRDSRERQMWSTHGGNDGGGVSGGETSTSGHHVFGPPPSREQALSQGQGQNDQGHGFPQGQMLHQTGSGIELHQMSGGNYQHDEFASSSQQSQQHFPQPQTASLQSPQMGGGVDSQPLSRQQTDSVLPHVAGPYGRMPTFPEATDESQSSLTNQSRDGENRPLIPKDASLKEL